MKDATDEVTADAFPDFAFNPPKDMVDEAAEAAVQIFLKLDELSCPEIPEALIPEPLGYRLIVRPKPAANKVGSLFVANRTKNTDLATRTIGQVLKIGPLAWRANMDGIDWTTDTVAHSIKPGDWVIYRQHGAQKIKVGKVPGAFADDEEQDLYLLLMSDTDVLAKLTPEQAATFFDWVS